MGFINSLPQTISQGLIWGIFAIGVYITYKVLNFSDLTVDGSICTGACISAVLIRVGINPWLVLIVAIIVGMLTGLFTGFINTILKIPQILSGILTQLILWSINLLIMGKANLGLSSRNFNVCVSMLEPIKAIVILSIIIVLLIGFLYWFFGTEYGCSIRATGDNPKMSKAQGINTKAITIFGLGISNGIVALAGSLLAQYQGFSDINMGRGAIVVGLASIVIGLSIIKLFTKNFGMMLFGCVVGSIIYYIIYQFVVFLGVDTDLLKMLSAIIVIIFLSVPMLKKNKIKKEINIC